MAQSSLVSRTGAPARPRGRSAASALAASVVASATVVASVDAPSSWAAADPGVPVATDAWAWLWHALAWAIPAAQSSARLEILTGLLVITVAAGATWAGYQLFRGPGRWLAAVIAGPLVTLSLCHYVATVGPAAAFPALPATLLGTLAVASVLRSLVHLGHVTAIARLRSLSSGAMATVIDPRAGLPLLLLLCGIAIGRQVPRLRSPAPPWRRWLPACAVIAVLLAVAVAVHAGDPRAWPQVTDLRLHVPDPKVLSPHLPAAILYSALTLLGLLVLPLRWRGGPSLSILAIAAVTVGDTAGPWASIPMMLVTFGTAAAGWVWMAGSFRPRPVWRGRALAASGAGAVLALGAAPTLGELHTASLGPVAARRDLASVPRLYGRGLLAPGDVLLALDNDVHRVVADWQAREGWRPDVILHRADQLDDLTLTLQAVEWAGEGRRIVSDSFSLGGRWNPAWAVDSGPLFWFVGQTEGTERQLTDLSRLPVPADAVEARRFERLMVERARFYRAVAEPQMAFSALPLPESERRQLLMRFQLAQSERPRAGADSELPALPGPPSSAPSMLARAEAGDLLFGQGDAERGTELLAAAASEGLVPAWGSLARWQLRAGVGAEATLAAMARSSETRPETLDVVWWLLARQRHEQASALLDQLRPTPHQAPTEIATRLMLLKQLARPGPEPTAPAPPVSVSRK